MNTTLSLSQRKFDREIARLIILIPAMMSLLDSALAQRPVRVSRVPTIGNNGGNSEDGSSILYNDTYNNGLYGLVSQEFPDYPSFSSRSYDDFSIPDGSTWSIDGLGGEGFYDFISSGDASGCVTAYYFDIVADQGGSPDCGNSIIALTAGRGLGVESQNVFGQAGGRFDYCPLSVGVLDGGTYWVSVAVDMPLSTPMHCGQWYFLTSAQPHRRGGNAYFDNPGGGFGTPPCVSWTTIGQDGDLTFTVYGSHLEPDCFCSDRAGNTDTGNGNDPADTVSVDGSVGDACREISVFLGSLTTVSVESAPTVGKGHYGLWYCDGEADDCTNLLLCGGRGNFLLGRGPQALPVNNTCAPGSVPCPVVFSIGRTSKSLGASVSSVLCLNKKPGFPKSPVSYTEQFPLGDFSIGALVQDLNSVNSPAKNISVSNTIVVHVL